MASRPTASPIFVPPTVAPVSASSGGSGVGSGSISGIAQIALIICLAFIVIAGPLAGVLSRNCGCCPKPVPQPPQTPYDEEYAPYPDDVITHTLPTADANLTSNTTLQVLTKNRYRVVALRVL